MKTRIPARITLLTFTSAFVIACSSGGAGGANSGSHEIHISEESFGGVIAVSGDSTTSSAPGVHVYAALYSSVVSDGATVVFPGATGECIESTGSNLTFTYKDVGPEIIATGAGLTVHATKWAQNPPAIWYVGDTSGSPSAGPYSIDIGGTTIGSTLIPSVPVHAIGNPTIVPGEPAVIEYTPNSGVEVVDIHINGNIIIHCYADGSGTFTVPADVTTALGPVDSGAINVDGLNQKIVTFEGKNIVLFGEHY